MKNKKSFIPFLTAVIGSVLLIISLFAPFASAKGEYRESLENNPEAVYSEEADMTAKDAVSISLTEFVKIDSAAAEMGISEETAVANMAIIIAFGVFAVLTLLFSLLSKPIAAIIFDILSFAVLNLIKVDFKDRGIIPSNSYDWGISQYICYIGIIAVAVGAVLTLIYKIKNKKNTSITE